MSQDFDRRTFIKGLAASGVTVTLAGCGGGDTTEASDDTPTEDTSGDTTEASDATTAEDTSGDTTEAGGGSGETYNVGMVYSTGGLGDNSFNDMAHQGIQQAQEEFSVEYSNAEPESASEFSTFQRQFATETDPNYDLIFTIGYSQRSTLQEMSTQFSDQKFTIIDTTVDANNVESYVFKEHEGSFQAGILAGLLTQQDFAAGGGETDPEQNVIGFVGGKEESLIKKFEAGYRFGAKRVNSDVEIKSAYAGSWSDPSGGQSIADSMMDDGADVLYHAAGGTGTGVIRAAAERGRFGIGVDARQSETLTEHADVILGSMVKQVDEAVLESVSNLVNDEFAGGEDFTLGLAEDGVSLLYGVEIGDEIPEDIKDEIETQSEQVANGELTVPSHPDDL